MDKLVSDIWKAIFSSLIVTTVIIGGMRYLEKEEWWKIYKLEDPDPTGPFVFYSVKGVDEKDIVTSHLFIGNALQKSATGKYGSFASIYPGQAVSLQINCGGHSMRIPYFTARDREIKHFSFEYQNGELKYLGSSFRIIKNSPPRGIALNPKSQNIFADYKPLETAEAKEMIGEGTRDEERGMPARPVPERFRARPVGGRDEEKGMREEENQNIFSQKLFFWLFYFREKQE